MKRFEGSDVRELRNVVRTVRRRWQIRHLLRGVLFSATAGLVALLAVRVLIDLWAWGPTGATVIAGLLYVSAAVIAFQTLLRPFLRRMSDRQVVLYLKEHEPDLRSEILTAIDAIDEGADPKSGDLLNGLIRSASLRAREVDGGRRVDQHALSRLSWANAGLVVVLALLLLADPLGFRQSVPDLVRPWTAIEMPSHRVAPRGRAPHLRSTRRLCIR
jgi:hypothetical protein